MLKGFRDFITRGNVMELAVAVIIGAAFNDVVKALTEVINQFLGAIVGKPNFDHFAEFTLGSATIQPGLILTALINFLILAAAVYFCLVAPMNKLQERAAARKASEAEAAPAAPTEAELLTEIRDLLAKK